MSQKNETKVLILSLLITLGLLGGGAWWFLNKRGIKISPQPTPNSTVSPPDSTPSPTTPVANSGAIEARISAGDKLLVTQATSPTKQAAIKALATGNYAQAVTELEAALQSNRNDPEALIYLNNAKIGDSQAYSIAVVVPSGSNIDGAKEIMRGVAQAQQEINASDGIKGTPIKILLANDDNNPEVAKQLAQALVDNPDVLGVVGHWSSGVTLAAGEVYQQEKLPVISAVSTSVKLSGAGNYIFRTVPSDRFAGSSLARYLLTELKQQKAAIVFNSQSNYSQSLKEVVATDLFGAGGEVVAEFDTSSPNFNAAEVIKQTNARDGQALMLATDVSQLDKALQVLQVNDGKLILLGGDSLYNAKTLQIGGKDALGMVLAIPWHILANPQAAFPQAARKLWGGEVSWRTAMAYDATKALIAALERQPSRQGVQQALSAPDFVAQGAAGEIRFLASGDRNQATQLVQVVSDTDNSTSFDYKFVPAP